MNRYQEGYFSRQTTLLLALLGLVLAFAVPKFGDLTVKNKLVEAHQVASASKLRLVEFYMLSGRFPSTEIELKSVSGTKYRQPQFVDSVEVISEDQDNDLVVRVYLKAGVIGNESSDRAYIYLAGNRAEDPSLGLEWHCGSSGVDTDLLPSNCSS